MPYEYELIDTDDNDMHDEGPRDLMQQYADERNADELRTGGNPDRWQVRIYGFSADNFMGVVA